MDPIKRIMAEATRPRDTASHHNTDGIVAAQLIRSQNVGEHVLAVGDCLLLCLRILERRKAVASLYLLLILVRIKLRHDKG